MTLSCVLSASFLLALFHFPQVPVLNPRPSDMVMDDSTLHFELKTWTISIEKSRIMSSVLCAWTTCALVLLVIKDALVSM